MLQVFSTGSVFVCIFIILICGYVIYNNIKTSVFEYVISKSINNLTKNAKEQLPKIYEQGKEMIISEANNIKNKIGENDIFQKISGYIATETDNIKDIVPNVYNQVNKFLNKDK
jgi:hypothetical protein